ncbi:MAG: CehA/McbA family metallohydrolase [Polyangiales bacterium]
MRDRLTLTLSMLSAALAAQCRSTQPVPTHTESARAERAPMTPPERPRAGGHVESLSAPRRSVHAYGRAGDMVLVGATGARLTIAATPDQAGHRPLRGAVLDVAMTSDDRPDPLLWWMPGVLDTSAAFHGITTSAVIAIECDGDGAGAGVRVEGAWDGRAVVREICAMADGRFRVVTRASNLRDGEKLGEDLVVGTSPAIIERLGQTWEGEQRTGFVALAEHGVAALIETPNTTVRRRPIRIAAEVFPAPIAVWHEGASSVTQFVRVREGDALDALAMTGAGRTIDVVMPSGRRGAIAIADAEHKPIAVGELSSAEARTITIPSDFGAELSVRDERGIVVRAPFPTGESRRVELAAQPVGTLRLRYQSASQQPLPVHVMLRGIAPTPDPTPTAAAPDRAGGNSLYLLRGSADVVLPSGRYRVTATHGFTWSLSTREVTVGDAPVEINDALRPEVDTSAYVTGDFHLHSAPSPDSVVSLEARVLTLLCEGVDFGVATDHNRISDFAPSARALGASESITTMVGNEITAGGRLWGHFNAFPLTAPSGAPEDAVSVYFQQTPADIFAAARSAGARVLQVNHPRMPPSIGYFELTHFDARTGQADQEFSNDFDAVEAFNGIWLETPDKVREGLRDLVGLVRRGLRPTATGNSDSHTLLFEEAGYPRTFVRTPSQPMATRSERVIEALRHGQTSVSSGPIVELTVEGQSPGAVVRPSRAARGRTPARVRAHVRVLAASWMPVEHVELWVDDQPAQRFNVGPARANSNVRFERDVELAVRGDATIAAWADAETAIPEVLPYAHARPIGFTSFVYVDADGDGRINVAAGATAVAPVEANPVHHH